METATTVPTWTLGDRLTKARHWAGLEQTELALRLGLNRRTISRYEAGDAPMYQTLLDWAEVCGVDANWLLTGTDTGATTAPNTRRYLQPELFLAVA